jgi:hypothetical protein
MVSVSKPLCAVNFVRVQRAPGQHQRVWHLRGGVRLSQSRDVLQCLPRGQVQHRWSDILQQLQRWLRVSACVEVFGTT